MGISWYIPSFEFSDYVVIMDHYLMLQVPEMSSPELPVTRVSGKNNAIYLFI